MRGSVRIYRGDPGWGYLRCRGCKSGELGMFAERQANSKGQVVRTNPCSAASNCELMVRLAGQSCDRKKTQLGMRVCCNDSGFLVSNG